MISEGAHNNGIRRVGQRRRVAMLAGTGLLTSIAAVGICVLAGAQVASAPWAVERGDDGAVVVEIYRPEDAAGLERSLAAVGVPAYVTFVPAGMVCIHKGFRSDPSLTPQGLEGVGGRLVIPPGRLAVDEWWVFTAYTVEVDGRPALGPVSMGVIAMTEERCQLLPSVNR
jgi:hypothetical protein